MEEEVIVRQRLAHGETSKQEVVLKKKEKKKVEINTWKITEKKEVGEENQNIFVFLKFNFHWKISGGRPMVRDEQRVSGLVNQPIPEEDASNDPVSWKK